jgi:methylthioribose-1-phosphate isomerase
VSFRALDWNGQALMMLDQRLLPHQETWIECRTWEMVRDGIRDMAVRGAPAIGISAAYGMVLARNQGASLASAKEGLAASRPTAVNLFWALDRMGRTDLGFWEDEARAIEAEDLAMNHSLAAHGAELVPSGATVLTICNTGSLATAGHGTALGIIRTAYAQGKVEEVFSCETRPRQQGLRLTAYELMKDGIPFRSIADSMAASLMQDGRIDFVVAGADRIAANGDSANKIGTLMLAVLAKHFGVPFVIAAPTSTIDPEAPNRLAIPIEEREASEMTHIEGIAVAPAGCPVYNPGFDVTPGELISAIVTEKGVARFPYSF